MTSARFHSQVFKHYQRKKLKSKYKINSIYFLKWLFSPYFQLHYFTFSLKYIEKALLFFVQHLNKTVLSRNEI